MGTLSEQQKQALERDGYVVFPGVLSQAMLARIIDCLETLWAEEGAAAGQENYNAVEANVRRLANLANKGDIFRELFAHPLVLAAAELVMGPDVRLSMLNARDALPHRPRPVASSPVRFRLRSRALNSRFTATRTIPVSRIDAASTAARPCGCSMRLPPIMELPESCPVPIYRGRCRASAWPTPTPITRMRW